MWVIASTSTTDWDGRNPVKVYPIFLLRPESRTRAWWARDTFFASKYPTREDAEAALALLDLNRDYVTSFVVPAGTDDEVLASIDAGRAAARKEKA
jgi:hypothetical protein